MKRMTTSILAATMTLSGVSFMPAAVSAETDNREDCLNDYTNVSQTVIEKYVDTLASGVEADDLDARIAATIATINADEYVKEITAQLDTNYDLFYPEKVKADQLYNIWQEKVTAMRQVLKDLDAETSSIGLELLNLRLEFDRTSDAAYESYTAFTEEASRALNEYQSVMADLEMLDADDPQRPELEVQAGILWNTYLEKQNKAEESKEEYDQTEADKEMYEAFQNALARIYLMEEDPFPVFQTGVFMEFALRASAVFHTFDENHRDQYNDMLAAEIAFVEQNAIAEAIERLIYELIAALNAYMAEHFTELLPAADTEDSSYTLDLVQNYVETLADELGVEDSALISTVVSAVCKDEQVVQTALELDVLKAEMNVLETRLETLYTDYTTRSAAYNEAVAPFNKKVSDLISEIVSVKAVLQSQLDTMNEERALTDGLSYDVLVSMINEASSFINDLNQLSAFSTDPFCVYAASFPELSAQASVLFGEWTEEYKPLYEEVQEAEKAWIETNSSYESLSARYSSLHDQLTAYLEETCRKLLSDQETVSGEGSVSKDETEEGRKEEDTEEENAESSKASGVSAGSVATAAVMGAAGYAAAAAVSLGSLLAVLKKRFSR